MYSAQSAGDLYREVRQRQLQGEPTWLTVECSENLKRPEQLSCPDNLVSGIA